jgi:hypothetical protein
MIVDMKEIVEFLQKKEIIFKSFKEVKPKELGSRKKVQLFVGVDLRKYYALVMSVKKKSRVLRKEVSEFVALHELLEKHIDSKIKKKHILIDAPLCTHAKEMLEEGGWRVHAIKSEK